MGLRFLRLIVFLFWLPSSKALGFNEGELNYRRLQETTITVVVETDQAPEETSWILFDSNAGVLIHQLASYSNANSIETLTLSVTEGRSYTLQVIDSASDGICCSNGEGSVTVYYGNQASGDAILAFSDGRYDGQVFLTFEASSSATLVFEPLTAPSMEPTDTAIPSALPSMFPSETPGPTITASPSIEMVSLVITVAILTDTFPEEISWMLVGDSDGAVLREVPAGTYATASVQELTTVIVTEGDFYTLILEDLASDGICCSFGLGEVRVFLGFPDANPLAYARGDYGAGISLGILASTNGVISVPPPPTPTSSPSGSTLPPVIPSPLCRGEPVPVDGCSICGPDMCVGNPEAIFNFPGQPVASCGIYEQAGLDGLIPLSQCAFLPPLVGVCECQPISPSVPPPSPTAPMTCPPVPSDGCNVCGDEGCVGNPEAIWTFPGQPTLPCGILELAGLDGIIPLSQCPFLPSLITVCGCKPISPSGPPPSPTAPTICPPVPSDGCNICGDEGVCVGNPEAIWTFPGQPTVSCGILQQAGLDGILLLPDQCPVIAQVIDVCDCQPGGTQSPPSVSPFAAPPGGRVPLVFVGIDACKSSPCGICEGDCDSDFECGPGLKCFNRASSSDPPPPGCFDAGTFSINGLDFCYDDTIIPPISSPVFAPNLPPITVAPFSPVATSPTTTAPIAPQGDDLPLVFGGAFACSSVSPCGTCEGDCDSDSECKPGLKCFHRISSSSPLPPGCFDSGSFNLGPYDYCYNANISGDPPLVFLGIAGCSQSNPCGSCEGDCDSDSDCAPGLQCFTRTSSLDPLPEGCFDSGTFTVADYDFCYNATITEAPSPVTAMPQTQAPPPVTEASPPPVTEAPAVPHSTLTSRSQD